MPDGNLGMSVIAIKPLVGLEKIQRKFRRRLRVKGSVRLRTPRDKRRVWRAEKPLNRVQRPQMGFQKWQNRNGVMPE